MKKEKTVFLTGATGFVGSNIAYNFLRKGYNLKFLVRDKNEDAKRRVEEVLLKVCDSSGEYKMWKDRIEVFKGDITKDDLGLSSDELSKLYLEVDTVFHCAANTSFDEEKRAEIEKNNVLGTKNILEFTRKLKKPDFHYMSTAYVCGKRKGVVYENELDNNQIFNNPYEESKFKAEKLIGAYEEQYNIKTTIYRPAIIVGNSVTGKTIKFLGFYSLVRAVYLLVKMFKKDLEKGGKKAIKAGVSYKGKKLIIPLRVAAIANKTLNIVPIDYVADVVMRIFKIDSGLNRTYHIVNPNPPTIGHIQRTICSIFNLSEIKIVDLREFQLEPMTPWENFFSETIETFSPYLQEEEPIFSDKNVQYILNGTSIRCPFISRGLIYKLISYCIHTNWGKEQ